MRLRSVLALAFSLVYSAPIVLAQQATISGEVTDSSGAALAGAKIIVTNIATNVVTPALPMLPATIWFPTWKSESTRSRWSMKDSAATGKTKSC